MCCFWSDFFLSLFIMKKSANKAKAALEIFMAYLSAEINSKLQ